MKSVQELDDDRIAKSEAARLARMTQNEFIIRSRFWVDEMNKRAGETSDRLKQQALKPITDSLQAYQLSLGDGSRELEGLSTGNQEIDHLIGGLNNFVLMAARAGTGKSTLAVQLALGVHKAEQVPIIFYSFEMKRADIFTLMAQNLRRQYNTKLSRVELVLYGNAPGLTSEKREAISEALDAINSLSDRFYVVDSSDGMPDLGRMEQDIKQVKAAHAGRAPLVIIDSIQDLVKPDNSGATIAEAQTAQRIVELQQSTNATFLAISQKSKGGNADDPYAGVLGSVAMLHKPTAVVELRGVHDLLRSIKDPYIAGQYRKLADSSDVPRPVIMSVLKGRNNGYGRVCLKHYGRFSYFENGLIADYHNGETSLYSLNGI